MEGGGVMPRIRTLKPGFFRSEDVAALSYRARLTWQGIWIVADDYGRCKDNARLLKADLWALEDDVTAAEVEKDLVELAEHGRITRYEVDGARFLAVTNWDEHQWIKSKSESVIPAPPSEEPDESDDFGTVPLDFHSAPEIVPVDFQSEPENLSTLRGRGKGRGKGRGRPARISTPAPENFPVTDDMRSWAVENKITVNLQAETVKFLSWHAARGNTFKDWLQAWRNWMLRAQDWAPPAPAKSAWDSYADTGTRP
jgi:hypothetical protein